MTPTVAVSEKSSFQTLCEIHHLEEQHVYFKTETDLRK